ncbi:apoptotic chromatin condensation inducer in the nucleus-like, partial [Mustelus asterias]
MQAVMETEASAECDPVELPAEGKEQQRREENSSPPDGDKKENAVPKAFKRKISVVSASKPPPAGGVESEAGLPARKRRWGSSTVATQKKPSISITTESLKNLIPDMKPPVCPAPGQGQEVVVDLHPDDGRISEDENERNEEEDPHDKGLKIRRTVTQVIQSL